MYVTQNIYLDAADPNLKPDLEYHLGSSSEISMTKKLHKLDRNGKGRTETYSIWYVTLMEKYCKKDLWHNLLPYTLFFISIKLTSILKLRCLKK